METRRARSESAASFRGVGAAWSSLPAFQKGGVVVALGILTVGLLASGAVGFDVGALLGTMIAIAAAVEQVRFQHSEEDRRAAKRQAEAEKAALKAIRNRVATIRRYLHQLTPDLLVEYAFALLRGDRNFVFEDQLSPPSSDLRWARRRLYEASHRKPLLSQKLIDALSITLYADLCFDLDAIEANVPTVVETLPSSLDGPVFNTPRDGHQVRVAVHLATVACDSVIKGATLLLSDAPPSATPFDPARIPLFGELSLALNGYLSLPRTVSSGELLDAAHRLSLYLERRDEE